MKEKRKKEKTQTKRCNTKGEFGQRGDKNKKKSKLA
jgi:hypothetical protein